MGKKSVVSTPLILLQQLSRSLLQHFEGACEQALGETLQVLDKLDKQRGKVERRMREAEVALEQAAVAGKLKAQNKARESIGALQSSLDRLLARQVQTRSYLAQLQRDVETSLRLAQGIGKVADAAGSALDEVASAPAARAATQPSVEAGAVALPKPRARRTAGAGAKPTAGAARQPGKPTES